MMEQNVQRGRRPRQESTGEAVAPELAAKEFVVKQKKSDNSKRAYIYTIEKGGGIYFSLPQNALTVYDESKNTVRSIRYCPNEPSIFVDEQSANAVREHVVFRKGLLAVPHTQPNLIAYLNAHPSNVANGGNLFRLMDDTKKAEVEVDMEFKIHEAIGLIREKSIADLLPVAIYLGINIDQDNMGIKRELLMEAKNNPTGFVKMFDNPAVRTRSAIMQASDFQILDNRSDGMYWFDSGRLIVSTPAGMDSVDVMTRFCLTEKGAPVYEQILERLESIA